MFFKTQRRISVDISFNTSCTGPVHPAGEVVVSSHALVLCCVLMNPTVSWFQSSCTCGENDFQLIKMIWRYVLRLTAYTSPHTCREKELHVISLPVGKRSWSPPTLLPSFYKLPLTGDWVTVAVNAKPSVKTSGLLRQSVCVHVCARTYQPVCVCVCKTKCNSTWLHVWTRTPSSLSFPISHTAVDLRLRRFTHQLTRGAARFEGCYISSAIWRSTRSWGGRAVTTCYK